MSDVFTKKKRSWVMSRIRSRGTAIEKQLAQYLKSEGIRFKKHPSIVGRPDFMVGELRIAIFVDGTFWHGYRMGRKALSRLPVFWQKKIRANKRRDEKVNRLLRKAGWHVIRIWEHDLERRPAETFSTLASALHARCWKVPHSRIKLHQ